MPLPPLFLPSSFPDLSPQSDLNGHKHLRVIKLKGHDLGDRFLPDVSLPRITGSQSSYRRISWKASSHRSLDCTPQRVWLSSFLVKSKNFHFLISSQMALILLVLIPQFENRCPGLADSLHLTHGWMCSAHQVLLRGCSPVAPTHFCSRQSSYMVKSRLCLFL